MADSPFNDNAAPTSLPTAPDAHGQAAILLVESLIHGLVARSLLSVAEAIEIVDIAADVKLEIGIDDGEPDPTVAKSKSILEAISVSLSFDLPRV